MKKDKVTFSPTGNGWYWYYNDSSEMKELLEKTNQLESKDKKYDSGKAMVGLMKKDFSKALLAVAEVTSYGIKKYNQPGSWRLVENASNRYEDALGRHDLQSLTEDYDKESGILHAAHRAWNALATLELLLETKNGREVERYSWICRL